ncbi:hypothetical protein NSZ01_05020 [Nocardioides szechwanensis]|uniref:Uncharacterized protein n=1 Tax=Nocardioides szechwanensis TaxID=1005944 RepID=A0A1G9W6L1_9ACTN|nr:hypothetical protein [Nocardioides szechwanensis]GEP32734.1 hypothetical protein NSZ01_05020 [Nocardioides szechwanensis]SDM79831.1 hypothetical protein SAMN05192576_0955 [Nocardioides szechwanensis]
MGQLITNNGSLPREYLEVIGKITVLSGRIESSLTTCITFAAGAIQGPSHNAIAALVADLGWSAKLDRLELLASRQISHNGERWAGAINRVVPDVTAEAIRKVVRLCREAVTPRNNVVHGTWRRGTLDGDRSISHVVLNTERNRGMHKSTNEIVDLDQLEEWAGKLELADLYTGILEIYLSTGDPEHSLKQRFEGVLSPPARTPDDLGAGLRLVRLVYVEGGGLAMQAAAATEAAAIEKLRRWSVTAVHRAPFAFERCVRPGEWESIPIPEIPGNRD